MEHNNNDLLKEKAIVHKDNSLNRLDVSFLKHINSQEYTTSHLLAFWINDYANYHDEKKTLKLVNLLFLNVEIL